MLHRLNIPAVNIKDKYPEILQCFQKELQQVQQEYNSHKTNPPLGRNIPHTATRITWCRQLYMKISEPVKGLSELPGFLDRSDTKRIIKGYNRLAQVLVEYELVHVQLWKDQLPIVQNSLSSTILIKNQGSLLVNFDPRINEFFREVQVLRGMSGIEVPISMMSLYLSKDKILTNYDTIKVNTIYMYMYIIPRGTIIHQYLGQ